MSFISHIELMGISEDTFVCKSKRRVPYCLTKLIVLTPKVIYEFICKNLSILTILQDNEFEFVYHCCRV